MNTGNSTFVAGEKIFGIVYYKSDIKTCRKTVQSYKSSVH